MTRDDITRMWEKANGWSPAELDETVKELERFAELVAAAEREACANVCGRIADSVSYETSISAMKCYEAIRARGSYD